MLFFEGMQLKRNKKPTQKNRYYKASKLSEHQFRLVVTAFTSGAPPQDTAKFAGISVRSANDILKRLRIRLFFDDRMSPLRSVMLASSKIDPTNQFWVHCRDCLYGCPTLRMDPYPEPIAQQIARPPAQPDPEFREWCGLCGILLHRRHLFWRPLEAWSRANKGLSQDQFAFHYNYVMEIGYAKVFTQSNWDALILEVLKSDPL